MPLSWALGWVNLFFRSLQYDRSWGCKPHWFSKLKVLSAHFSGAALKSLDTQCEVKVLYSWGKSFRFWVPSWLWVIILGVGFMVKLCPSFSSLQCGFLNSPDVSLPLRKALVFCLCFCFPRGNCFIHNCILGMFVRRDEFKIFLHCPH